MKKILISLFLLLSSFQGLADNLSDSNRLFDFAEVTLPQYFSPSESETISIDGYLARYYSYTNVYLGTQAEDVYVYGDIFSGLQHVGVISDFIEPTLISDISITKEVIDDSQGDSGRYSSIAVGEDNSVHVIYNDENNIFHYALRAENTWYTESLGDSLNNRSYPSIIVDSEGNPHIVYVAESKYVTYITKVDGQWHKEVIGGALLSSTENQTSILLIDNKIHLIYNQEMGGGYHSIRSAENNWNITKFRKLVHENWDVTVDSEGKIYYAVNNLGIYDPTITMFVYNGVSWNYIVYDVMKYSGVLNTPVSLAVDSNNQLHFLRAHGVLAGLHVYTLSNDNVSSYLLSSRNFYTGKYNFLKINKSNHYHYLYTSSTLVSKRLVDLVYIRQVDDEYHVKVVESTAAIPTGLAIDRNGDAHILYYHNSDLKYVYAKSI